MRSSTLLRAATALMLVAGASACDLPPGPAPLWSADKNGDNPFPDERHQNAAGALVVTPDLLRHFLPKGIDTVPTDDLLKGWSAQFLTVHGAGLMAPVLLRFDAPLDALIDADKLSDRGLLFVRLDGTMAPIAARGLWRKDPGVLEVQPLQPLPPHARVALVVTRSLVEGLRMARSADFEAHANGDGKADVEAAAKALDLSPNDLALVIAYRTGGSAEGLLTARDLVKDIVPAFSFDNVGDGRHGVFTPDTAPDTLTANPDTLAARIEGAGVVAIGTYTTRSFRDPVTKVFDEDMLAGTAAPAEEEIEVVLLEPDPALFPPPWPAVILQHGFGGSNAFVADNAKAFVQRGLAVLGIDAVSHGRRGAVTAFFRLDDPRVVRDNLRQTVVDQLILGNLATRGGIDVDGIAGPDLDGSLAYYGHSMGAVIGGMFAMVSPDADVVAVNAAGGGLCNVFRSVDLTLSLQFVVRPLLGIGIDDLVYDDAYPLLTALGQPLFEGADPIVQARPTDRPNLLLQMDTGDLLVPNTTTEDLARALGLTETTGPKNDDNGFSALTVMNVPDFPEYGQDKNPHGLFEVPAIQAQAAQFIKSRGTELLAAP